MKRLLEITIHQKNDVTLKSVMPCHLNGDVHEWFNEVVTVPNQDLLNSLTLVKMPATPSGKRRPCGPLLQLVVVTLSVVHSIGRSVDA